MNVIKQKILETTACWKRSFQIQVLLPSVVLVNAALAPFREVNALCIYFTNSTRTFFLLLSGKTKTDE